MKAYYTEEEKVFVVKAYRSLRKSLETELSWEEVSRLRKIIQEGIESGLANRDKYGINPTVRHLHTALLLTEYIGADKNIIIATLLYHLCSTDFFPAEKVKEVFGDDICSIVQGLLKVSALYKHQTSQKDENFSKLMMAFAENIRVIIIMIVDRLALMKAINHHPNQKFVFDIAGEALYLYAPLAHRLGLYKVKSELEDLSLKYTNRELYTQIAHKLNESKKERDEYIAKFIAPIKEKLQAEGLTFEIKGRTKSIYSIWNKMRKQNADLKDIYDLFAIRIILDTAPNPIQERKDCWKAFAIVTDMFKPNPSRLKDWISIPKSNGYESLHTTVTGPNDRWVEVQIRTRRMDEIAEKGLAAHWKYKGVKSEKSLDDWMANVRDMLETSGDDAGELMKKMNMDIYDKEVFAFTPKGDLFKLPLGATVLDMAFAIHSKIGCSCVGGKVNGKQQKINYQLKNGDTVEILTASSQQPKQQWLTFVVTSKARNKIRQSLNESNNRSSELAKELLQRRFKNRKIEIEEAILTKVIKKLGYKTATDFFNDIANEKLDIAEIVDSYIAMVEKDDEQQATVKSAKDFVMLQTADTARASDDVVIIGEGIKGINYKLSKCCAPIQGDEIMGFITSDGAIKIHKSDCPNARHLLSRYPYRSIKAVWSERVGENQFAVPLYIVGNDDIGIVNNITSLVTKEKNVSLRSIAIDSNDGLFQGRLVVGVSDTVTLNGLIKKIATIKGIKDVRRNN